MIVLDSGLFSPAWGWRFAFIVGGALALGILPLRRFVPESPRWLLLQRRHDEAESIVAHIARDRTPRRDAEPHPSIVLDPGGRIGWFELFGVLLRRYPRRVVLGVSLMSAQAFLYNAIFFTYALVLTRYYGVSGFARGPLPASVRRRQLSRAAAARAAVRPRRDGALMITAPTRSAAR